MLKSKPLFLRISLAYGIVLAVTFVAFIVRKASGQFDPETNRTIFYFSFFLFAISWEILRMMDVFLNRVFPFERSITIRIILQLTVGVMLAILFRGLIYRFGEPHLPIPLDGMFLASTWVLYILAVSVINSIFITRYFIEQWKETLVQAERLEKEKALVQFDNLKNQLNPHFLFNALTSLNSLIFENQDLASKFLQHLSKVYRYVLQNKDKNFVPIQTELDFIQNYVFLLHTRFEKALTVVLNINEDARDRAVVPVTLQILIENAVKHNCAEIEKPLIISIVTIDDYLVVSNNLQSRKLVESSNKLGLENLKSLYRFLTDRPVLIELTEDRFAVKIPLV